MKIRTGFVSNSSSSSYVIVGVPAKKLSMKEINTILNDIDDEDEWTSDDEDEREYHLEMIRDICDSLEDEKYTGFSIHYDPEDGIEYGIIGISLDNCDLEKLRKDITRIEDFGTKWNIKDKLKLNSLVVYE